MLVAKRISADPDNDQHSRAARRSTECQRGQIDDLHLSKVTLSYTRALALAAVLAQPIEDVAHHAENALDTAAGRAL
jgi:hypothetical protein